MIARRFQRYADDIRSLPADVARAWRSAGWEAIRHELRRRTLDRIGGYTRRFVIESDLSRLLDVAPPEEVDIRVFPGGNWALLGDLMRSRLPLQFEEAAASGHICIVAWKRRSAVGYAWFSARVERGQQGLDLPLPPDTIYIWQITVNRAQRGEGIAAALLAAGLGLARERGFHRSWLVLDPENVVSGSAIAGVVPSRVLGTVARLKIFWWIRSRYRALHTPVPIEAGAS